MEVGSVQVQRCKNAAERRADFLGPKIQKKLSETNVTNSCQKLSYGLLWRLRRTKPAEYFHCVVWITELHDEVVMHNWVTRAPDWVDHVYFLLAEKKEFKVLINGICLEHEHLKIILKIYTWIQRTRLSTVGDRAFPVAGSRLQSAARRHLSSNVDCFSEPPQNLSLFPIIYELFSV